MRYTVGRSRICDIVISDETVSRMHAILTDRGDGTCGIKDCNSRGGSFLLDGDRSVRLEETVVSLDDRIRLGQFDTTPRDLLDLLPSTSGKAKVEGIESSSGDVRVEVARTPDRGLKKGGRMVRDPRTGRIVNED